MSSDNREWLWRVECSGSLPEPFHDLGAKPISLGSQVYAVRASRALIDAELPLLLAAKTVTRATCLGSPSQPQTRPLGRPGTLVLDRRLAQQIWSAADILGGPWTIVHEPVPGRPDTYFEDPVTMCWDDPDNFEITLLPREVYGSKAVHSWWPSSDCSRPDDLPSEIPHFRRLSDAKERPDADFNSSPVRVGTYTELVDRVAFLAVMNKTLNPLLRGQSDGTWKVQASLYRRDELKIEDKDGVKWGMAPGNDVEHYLKQLGGIEHVVYCVLQRQGLPRTAHIDPQRGRHAAIWAVIQHYELWPTPLVDFTTSLRVAATFAFGFARDEQGTPTSEQGFVYVYGVPTLTSDLMQPRGSSLAVRLNSVCPPGARRPHLQDGVLVGHDDPTLVTTDRSVAAIPLAKIHLDNRDGGFWDTEDFPPLSQSSLLPNPDELRDELRRSLRYYCDDAGMCFVSSRR